MSVFVRLTGMFDRKSGIYVAHDQNDHETAMKKKAWLNSFGNLDYPDGDDDERALHTKSLTVLLRRDVHALYLFSHSGFLQSLPIDVDKLRFPMFNIPMN